MKFRLALSANLISELLTLITSCSLASFVCHILYFENIVFVFEIPSKPNIWIESAYRLYN